MTDRTVALLVAAGQGSRAGGDIPKQFRPIGGKPVLIHAVDALARHPAIDSIVLVVGAGERAGDYIVIEVDEDGVRLRSPEGATISLKPVP